RSRRPNLAGPKLPHTVRTDGTVGRRDDGLIRAQRLPAADVAGAAGDGPDELWRRRWGAVATQSGLCRAPAGTATREEEARRQAQADGAKDHPYTSRLRARDHLVDSEQQQQQQLSLA